MKIVIDELFREEEALRKARQRIEQLRGAHRTRAQTGRSSKQQLSELGAIWAKTPLAFLRPADQWDLPLDEHNRRAFGQGIQNYLRDECGMVP